jgi:hypothetical protein
VLILFDDFTILDSVGLAVGLILALILGLILGLLVGLILGLIVVGIADGFTEVGNTVFTIVGVALIPGIILFETGL